MYPRSAVKIDHVLNQNLIAEMASLHPSTSYQHRELGLQDGTDKRPQVGELTGQEFNRKILQFIFSVQLAGWN